MSYNGNYETGLALVNEITITLNKIEDANPDAKEYIAGIRDVVAQVLKSMGRGKHITEKQVAVLQNILTDISISSYN